MVDGQLFKLEDISYSYGDKPAIQQLSLGLRPGRFYGLIGPNGCGKSTLLDLLIDNRTPDSGKICFSDQLLTNFPKRELARHIALVPQDFTINFAFTVQEVVLMGRHPYIPRFGQPSGDDLAIVDLALAEIGISDFVDRFVTELSGGEKQRVVVARALAQQTPVLLLDEATSNLDIQYSLEILNVLKRKVEEQQATVIAVMHNLNLAAAYCEEIVLMKGGGVFAAGPTTDILTTENIREVFAVESRVAFNEFSQSLGISYRYGDRV